MSLLFHCCCAPCMLSCVDELDRDGVEFQLFWYNSNIHPYTEYSSRYSAFIEFAEAKNLKAQVLGEYGLKYFISAVLPHMENNQAGRCKTCYRLRFEKTAAFAAQNGFRAFTTSLLISPYQDHDLIRSTAEEAAAKYSIAFLYRDFCPHFRSCQSKVRSLGYICKNTAAVCSVKKSVIMKLANFVDALHVRLECAARQQSWR